MRSLRLLNPRTVREFIPAACPRAGRLAVRISIFLRTSHFHSWFVRTSDISKTMILSVKGTFYMYLLLVYSKTVHRWKKIWKISLQLYRKCKSKTETVCSVILVMKIIEIFNHVSPFHHFTNISTRLPGYKIIMTFSKIWNLQFLQRNVCWVNRYNKIKSRTWDLWL